MACRPLPVTRRDTHPPDGTIKRFYIDRQNRMEYAKSPAVYNTSAGLFFRKFYDPAIVLTMRDSMASLLHPGKERNTGSAMRDSQDTGSIRHKISTLEVSDYD
jgi:hypothetical protein